MKLKLTRILSKRHPKRDINKGLVGRHFMSTSRGTLSFAAVVIILSIEYLACGKSRPPSHLQDVFHHDPSGPQESRKPHHLKSRLETFLLCWPVPSGHAVTSTFWGGNQKFNFANLVEETFGAQ